MPIQLSYAQYGVFVVLVPLFMLIHYLFTFHIDIIPGVGDRAVDRHDVVHISACRSRPAGPQGGPHGPHRLAPTREPVAERREPRLVATRVRIREELT